MNKLLTGNKIINIINNNSSLNYDIEDNSSLVINFFHQDLANNDINITIKNNSSLVINYAGICSKDTDIHINVLINGDNNKVIINNRIIGSLNKCSLYVDVYTNKKTINNIIEENIKGINEQGMVRIMPILRIDSHDVSASHSASVGKIDKEIIFYLKSKGLDEQVIFDLIKQSFLYQLFSENFISMIKENNNA